MSVDAENILDLKSRNPAREVVLWGAYSRSQLDPQHCVCSLDHGWVWPAIPWTAWSFQPGWKSDLSSSSVPLPPLSRTFYFHLIWEPCTHLSVLKGGCPSAWGEYAVGRWGDHVVTMSSLSSLGFYVYVCRRSSLDFHFSSEDNIFHRP